MTKVIKHNFLKSSDLCRTSWTFPVALNDDQRTLSQGVGAVTVQNFKDQLDQERKKQVLLRLLSED
jgi:hypothetical protein